MKGVISIAAFPTQSLGATGGLNFSTSPAIKSSGDKSFLGLLTLLAAEGSGLRVGYEDKGGYVAGWGMNQADGTFLPASSVLNADGQTMMAALIAGSGAAVFLHPENMTGIGNSALSAPAQSTPSDVGTSPAGDAGMQVPTQRQLVPADVSGPDATEMAGGHGTNAATHGKEAAFINRLMGALQGRGLSPYELQEIERMLTSLTIERQGPSSNDARLAQGVREIVINLGITPQELDRAGAPGSVSPEAALRPEGAKAGMAGLSARRDMPDLPATGAHPAKTEAPVRIVSEAGQNSMAARSGEAEMTNGTGRPFNTLDIDQKTGVVKVPINTGHENVSIALAGDSASGTSPNDMIGPLLRHAGGGTAIIVDYGDVGEEAGGRDRAGDGSLDATGVFAPASNSGKASPAEGADFEQQLSRTQGREVAAQKVMEQVVSGARMQVESGRTRAKIFLDPPALGKVTLHIVTKDDQVRVAFYAETPQVKEIIESNLSQLRQSFAEQGMRADNVEVFVGFQQAGSQAWQSPAFDVPEVPGFAMAGQGTGDDTVPGHERQRISGNNLVDVFI